MKRYRAPKAKPGELKAQWGKLLHENPDLCYAWGVGASRADGHLLHNVLSGERFRPGSFERDPSLLDELKTRGYDLTTLKFSIQKTAAAQQGRKEG